MEERMDLLLGVGIGVLLAVLSSVRIYREYERAVVFRLGRARKRLAGPGLVMLMPLGIDRIVFPQTSQPKARY